MNTVQKTILLAGLGLLANLGFPRAAQAAPFTLSKTNLLVSPAAGITNVVLTANTTTNPWTAMANTNWLNLVTCGNGTSTNSEAVVIGYQVNTGPARTGTLTIAGLTMTVRQQGAAAATTLLVTGVGTNCVTFNGAVTPNAGVTAGSFQYSPIGGWLVSTAVTGVPDYCSARCSLAEDSDGNFYMCQPDCNYVLKISTTGTWTHLWFDQYLSYWQGPSSVIVDEDNNLYVAENWSIRKYTATTGVWSVFAGDPYVTQQSVDGVGRDARFRSILGMVRDSLGNFYVSCMYTIRRVTTNAVVTTLTDQGTSVGQRDGPAFGTPLTVAFIDGATGIAVDDYSGNLYWCESSFSCGLHGVRKLNLTEPGMVTTLAGAGTGYADGTGSVARFYLPMNGVVDKSGNFFVTDAVVNNAIRKMTPNGVVTTLNCLDANTGSPVSFSQLAGGMMDKAGNLVVVDHGRDSICRIGYRLANPVTVPAQSGLTGTNPVAVSNTISGLHPGTTYYYWTVASNSTSTNHGEILSFTTLQSTSTVVLASAPNPALYGEDVTFTATVLIDVPGWPVASGTVVFKDAGVTIGTGTLSGGVAVLITNCLSLGSHSLTAEYGGDSHYEGSTTLVSCAQTINRGVPKVTNWPTANALLYGQTLASALLTGGAVTPTGLFAWVNASIAPDLGTVSHDVVFTPTDTFNYTTTNGTVSVTVNKAPPTITAWPTASAILMGDPLSASLLSGGSVTPVGSFAWALPANRPHGGTALQSVIYTPDDTTHYLSATGTVSVTVNAVVTSNTLSSSVNPSAEGEQVTFSVTVFTPVTNCYTPNGSVTFKDGATPLGSATLIFGTATFTTNSLGAGAHSITSEYRGNANFIGSTNSPALIQAVNPALVVLRNPDTNAIALSAAALNTQQMVATVFQVGSGHMLLAGVSLRLRHDFTISPANDSIRSTLYDVTVSNLPAAALAVCDSSVINIAKSDTSWYDIAFSGDLRNYLLQAGHTYALGISIPTAGSSTNRSIKNITAQDTPYTMAPGYTFVQNVRSTAATPTWSTSANRFGMILTGAEVPRTPSATEVSSDVNPAAYGTMVTLTAVVSPGTVSGTVAFKEGGVTRGTGVVSEGVATFATRLLDLGRHDITAEYSGDITYEGSASSPLLGQMIIPPTTVITRPATGVAATSATLCGRVDPNGLLTDSFFRYATNSEWLVSTLAGTNASYADGLGTEAAFYRPFGVAMDRVGNVIVADTLNCRIRKITPVGWATTLAGTNPPGFFADGPGSLARFSAPYGVAVDNADNVYLADCFNHRIRKITTDNLVTTLAGTNTPGYIDGTGCDAQFFRPQGVAVDGAGNVIVADTYNHCIRQVSQAGVVTTLAGTNTAGYADGLGGMARFNRPQGVALDSAGILYVADSSNNCIRRVTAAGGVTTLAGTNLAGCADGPGASAQFSGPSGVAVDSVGRVYVADCNNHRIRRITPDGWVTTLAGTNLAGYADGSGASAQFNGPFGVTVDSAGNVYVADSNNNRIRKLEHALVEPVITVSAQSGLPGTSTATISRAISGLRSGATYYFHALVTTSAGNHHGSVLSFTPVGACVQSFAVTNGTATFLFSGIPGENYHVERTTNLTESVVWTPLTTENPLQPGPDGSFAFSDPTLPQAAAVFYRLLQSIPDP